VIELAVERERRATKRAGGETWAFWSLHWVKAANADADADANVNVSA